jgi:hypothetical protein
MNRLTLLALAPLAACSSVGDSLDSPDAGGLDGRGDVIALSLSPEDTLITVRGGEPVSQTYTAIAQLADGTTRDVTEQARFTVANPRLGVFDGPRLSARGAAGGRSVVRAHYLGMLAEAELSVRVEAARVDETAPQDARELFQRAEEDEQRAPSIVYPSSDTIFPPNIGDFEVHWIDDGGSDLFEITLAGEFVELRAYVAGEPHAGSFLTLTPEDWAVVGASAGGESLSLSVRGLRRDDPSAAGTSPASTIQLAGEDVRGGLYYWASAGTTDDGIYRHDMARPGEPAEPFYTRSDATRCVACHVLSRDGSKMAITYDGGNGPAAILDVATRAPITADDESLRWNFAAYDATGERLITVHDGVMMLRDGTTGEAIKAVPTGGYATHPDLSPRGDAVVYTAPAAAEVDWVFQGGRLVVQTYDADTDTFGAPTTLVEVEEGYNVYYPSFSPDGAWVLYNRSTGDSYDDDSAELFVVPTDGSRPPRRLDSPNVGVGITNSWARWAPFAQALETDGDDEPYYWLTFSSKRAFGVRLEGGQPQIWMAPFFPERARAEGDPSAPAFRLPFQDLATHNHIAQWTESIIPPIE